MIPEFQAVMRPVLELLVDGQVRRSRDLYTEIADWFQLSEAERAVLVPSGRRRVIDLAERLEAYRVGTQEELTVTLYRLDEDFFDTL